MRRQLLSTAFRHCAIAFQDCAGRLHARVEKLLHSTTLSNSVGTLKYLRPQCFDRAQFLAPRESVCFMVDSL